MKTILIVEDEPSLAKTLSSVLTDDGYKTFQAPDGETAIEIAKREKPNLVLLDLVIPRKHGLEVLKEMKEYKEISAIPVIVLTNLESTEDVLKAMELGAKAYLVKANYSIKDVLEKVHEALK